MVRGRSCEDISNDISENIPVTKTEALRVLKWERQNLQKLMNKHNALRDEIVGIGLILSGVTNATPNERVWHSLSKLHRALAAP